MFLLDLWRQQTSSNVWIEAWCDLVTKWKPAFWAEEKTQITSGVGPFITARARERQALYKARAISDTPRQGGACAEHPWPHGARRLVRARPRAMAGGPEGRAAR